LFVSVVEFLVIRAEKLLSFNQSLRAKPLFKPLKLRVKPVTKTLEIPVPRPTIFHPILPRLGHFTPYFREQITLSLEQQLRPKSARTESGFKLCPPAVRNPKPSIHYKLLLSEPRGV
jgi:hypothetical protein